MRVSCKKMLLLFNFELFKIFNIFFAEDGVKEVEEVDSSNKNKTMVEKF